MRSQSVKKRKSRSDDEKWAAMFNELLRYKAEFGTFKVQRVRAGTPTNSGKYYRLGSWIQTQRNQHNKGILPENRRNRLLVVGFDFEPKKDRWEHYISQLLEFKKIHGHCYVPRTKKKEKDSLEVWVSNLRERKHLLSPERLQRLLEIGFVFDVRQQWWDDYYNALIKYKHEYGTWEVPQQYDFNLYLFVKRMRYSKINNKRVWMTVEQETKLDEIGFDWTPELTNFDSHYKNLSEFRRKHGHTIVSSYERSFNGLGVWVHSLRKIKRLLTKKQVKKLDEIGFVWNSQAAKNIAKHLKERKRKEFNKKKV